MAMKLKWFGVKMFLRTEAVGPVRNRDANYDPDGTLVEERIMVVRARDPNHPADRIRRILVKEAIRYRNAYGQLVRSRILKSWRTYELCDPPADLTEVFSDTNRFSAALTDGQIARRFATAELTEAHQRRRMRFIAADLATGLDVIWKRRRQSRTRTRIRLRGKSISAVEVNCLGPDGFWLLLDERELFVPFKDFPWFQDARIREIMLVERPSPHHLRWPELDIDLAVESIESPGRFPLLSRVRPTHKPLRRSRPRRAPTKKAETPARRRPQR